jgi:RNA polymerase sigma factor (sigma-70 family)
MTQATLHDALLEHLLARLDETDAPASSAHKGALLGVLHAATWCPSLDLRQEGLPRRSRTDLELARDFRDGDATAFEQLFVRYHGKLIAYACRAGCPHEAEDFAQAAFIALIATAPMDKPNFKAPAYLFKVVRNRAIKHILKRTRQLGLDDAATVPDDHARSQLDQLIHQHTLARAAELLEASCTPAEQAVLTLTHTDLSANEIAEQLEITAVHVRVLRHRALAKLRAAFEEEPS